VKVVEDLGVQVMQMTESVLGEDTLTSMNNPVSTLFFIFKT